MNKLKTLLCAVFTLMLVNITTAQSDSSNFAGPYVGLTASGYGIQLDGTSRSNSAAGDSVSGAIVEDRVSVGQVAPVSGIEVGYVLPLGSMFLVDLGAAYYSGEAKVDHVSDDPSNKKASFTMDDLVTYYIAPTIVLSDTSSLYVKMGLTEADIGVTGDITTPADLSGKTWAVGTRTVLESGIFIRTEAGYTDYNGISAAGKGNQIAAKTTYAAEPTVAFGAVSLGFRF